MTALLVDPCAGDRLLTLPHRWVVGSSSGEYAHLPRSAATHRDRFSPGGRRLTVHALCGVLFHEPILTDDPVGPRCGTCVGRELGLLDDAHAWRPRTIRTLPKRWCRSVGYVEIDYRTGICLLCGHRGPVRARYGWNTSGAQMVRHEHGGRGHFCPEHGQQWLYAVGDTLLCNGFVSGGTRCPHPLRPFWLVPSHPGGSIR